MATIQELKRQIEKANELGVQNLADKGVGFVGITPTTYDIMQGIADILTDGGGGDISAGIQYRSITYNDDDTIILIDTDGVTHTMSCAYDGDRLVSVSYDGKEMVLTYDGDDLIIVGETAVNMNNAVYTQPKMQEYNSIATPLSVELGTPTITLTVKESE